jgi:hypothetical protein
MKKIFLTLVFVFIISVSFGQIRTFNTTSATVSGQSVFLDASAGGFSNSENRGKGLAFPRTDLTTFTFVSQGNFLGFPTGYDGMLIYNTATGISTVGGGVSVTPGFYYFSNTSSSGSTSTGTWKPLGSEGSPKIHITENTPTETNLVTANTATEKVISITGTADGITTHIDLGTTVLPKDTVVNFRKAIICDSNGTQVLVATGSYDSATNKFVTGNGMMNYCLPAANDYKVELYFTSN